MSNVLFVIAPEQFRDEELFEARAAVEAAGHSVTLASVDRGLCTGSRGGTAVADLALAEVNLANFDAVVFVGGAGSQVFLENKLALDLARRAVADEKILAAICLAPMILAHAGLLQGKQVTVTESEINNLPTYDAHYTTPGVTTDGKIITADGPASARAFGEAIASRI